MGSRLGNSLLLRFTEKENYQVITLDDNGEPPVKRTKPDGASDSGISDSEKMLDSLNDCMASDVLDIRDPEELEVYGNERQASLQITSYVFEVSRGYYYLVSFLFVSTLGEMYRLFHLKSIVS